MVVTKIELRKQGKSIQAIADLTGSTYSKTYYFLLKHGLAGTARQTPSPIDYDLLYDHVSQGGSIRQFCIKHNIKRPSYFHYMNRDWGSTCKENFMEKYNAF